MLIAKNLSFGYQTDNLLFSCLSFTLHHGEIWHLYGDNGIGKTTLFQGMMGLINLNYEILELEGSATLNDFRTNTTYLPADKTLGAFSYLSATENLKLFSPPQLQQIPTYLQKWGFDNDALQHRLKLKYFSTGMKKRLACIQAQIQQKPLWILDEPTHGLDQTGMRILTTMITHHQQQGGMVLFASHHYQWAKMVRTHTLNLLDFV